MDRYFQELTDRLYQNNPKAIESSIQFIEADSKQVGHGRVRALMCRRLKHCTLSKKQRTRLIDHIAERLCTGNFAQQFKDELRLALFLDPQRILAAARLVRNDSRDYVRRYAEWVLAHQHLPKSLSD